MIIKSILDNDQYCFTLGQLALHQLQDVWVESRFINRGMTEFPTGFADQLRDEVKLLSTLSLSDDEERWLCSLPYFKSTYIEWLKGFRFNPGEVNIEQEGGRLRIEIIAPLHRIVYWEVALLAIISEVFFENEQCDVELAAKLANDKAYRLECAEVEWGETGTRRRFSGAVHRACVRAAKKYSYFLGTSNLDIARTEQIKPIGSMPHLGPMVMQAVAGIRQSNTAWCEAWLKEYENHLQHATVLPDTLTSLFFFDHTFNGKWARIFDSVRQDSGDPDRFVRMLVDHYDSLGIDPKGKRVVFSDGQTDASLIDLAKRWRDHIKVRGNMGTYFSNDVGVKPLNIVFKPMWVLPNDCQSWVGVVKLSDSPGKASGPEEAMDMARAQIG